jgi:hypothetical protein
MGSYGEILEDFYAERTRILKAFGEEPNRKVVLRLIGALAFRTHCPQFGRLQDELGREFTDIDFASYPRHLKDILRVLGELGYKEDKAVTQLFSDSRLLFHDPLYHRHIDVFFNNLVFCHTIPFAGRLEAESETLPLAELLLEKMQIFQINEKDIIDTIMLLMEHPLGNSDHEVINIDRVAELLAKDWGLWRTTTMNLGKVRQMADHYPQLDDKHKVQVVAQVDQALSRIEAEPKSTAWRLRSRVGDRVKWYKDVDEVG